MSGKPVIAMVTDVIHPYHRGGKETRYAEIAARLSSDFDVHVYTMRWWAGPRTFRRDGVTYHALCRALPLYQGARRSIPQALWFALSCMRLLGSRFDVLEADHMPYLPVLACRVVTWLRRKRFVVTWHEVWGLEYWRGYLGALGSAAWFVERLAMRLPDVIISASDQTAERLRIHLGERTEVVAAPNGVDLDVIRRTDPAPDGTDVVVVGRLMNHKRVDLLLDALALLSRRGEVLSCRVIGDGPERERLVSRARELGLAAAVRFEHDVADQASLYAMVKAARVFAAPSAREGFGVAVLEALACGVPVVTTIARDNLARHLVRLSDRGFVSDEDPESFADALQRALASTVGPGEAWVEAYGWDETARRVARTVCP